MGRWYFGGLASAGAACCTHPLDLIKVGLASKIASDICWMGQHFLPSGPAADKEGWKHWGSCSSKDHNQVLPTPPLPPPRVL